jgi:hypothetical protein
MARKATKKDLEAEVERLNRQVCTVMAYIAHLEEHQKVAVEERFVEAAAHQLLHEQGSAKGGDDIRAAVRYLATKQLTPAKA